MEVYSLHNECKESETRSCQETKPKLSAFSTDQDYKYKETVFL